MRGCYARPEKEPFVFCVRKDSRLHGSSAFCGGRLTTGQRPPREDSAAPRRGPLSEPTQFETYSPPYLYRRTGCTGWLRWLAALVGCTGCAGWLAALNGCAGWLVCNYWNPTRNGRNGPAPRGLQCLDELRVADLLKLVRSRLHQRQK